SDVHGPEARARRHPGHRGRQPGVHLSRRVQRQQGRGRGSEVALPRRQGRRRRGEDQARPRAEHAPGADPRAARGDSGETGSPQGDPVRRIEARPEGRRRHARARPRGDEDFLSVSMVNRDPVEHATDFESAADAFPVKLSNFEGPLDLLLHLIRKHELDIHDIPIALITAQYLDAIALLQELDLDVAGEYIVMAATLIHIKSKMLLPRPETAAGVEGEVEDPRDALVRRLLEHQKFKAAAGLLHEREQLRAAQWLRPDGRIADIAGNDYEPEFEVDLFSLLTAFQGVVQRAKQRPRLLLPPEQISVEVRIDQLLARLSETEACGFDDLFADVNDRSGLIVTFLALLEMIRLKLVRVFQSGGLGPIRVYKRSRPADAPHPIGDPEGRRG